MNVVKERPTPSVTLRLGSSALRLSSPFLSVPEGSLAPSFVSLSGLAVRSSVPARFPSPRSSVRHSPRHSPTLTCPPARKRPVGPATHLFPWPVGAPLTRPFGRPAPEPGPIFLTSLRSAQKMYNVQRIIIKEPEAVHGRFLPSSLPSSYVLGHQRCITGGTYRTAWKFKKSFVGTGFTAFNPLIITF